MKDLPQNPNDSAGHSLPRELNVLTRHFHEPISMGSSNRSGGHPILQVKVAAEVRRSPKVGLVALLMEEGRELFVKQKYRAALVKFLAVDELIRRYGEVIVGLTDFDPRDELEFMKIQFYFLSGQASEACRVLKNLNYKGSSYLAHRRFSEKYHLDATYWQNLGKALRQIFSTNHCGRIFALLGYVTVMGPQPYVAKSLSLELGFTPSAGDDIFQPFLLRHHSVISESSPADGQNLPEYLAVQYLVTPLCQVGGVLYLGVARPLAAETKAELRVRTGYEIVEVPVIPERILSRNREIYEVKKTA